jgi:hypothetical protein
VKRVDSSVFCRPPARPDPRGDGQAVLVDPTRRVAREILDGEAALFLSGVLALVAGLSIVNTHDAWAGWPVVITAVGWLLVLGAVRGCLCPGR